jgi:hypothetical protein
MRKDFNSRSFLLSSSNRLSEVAPNKRKTMEREAKMSSEKEEMFSNICESSSEMRYYSAEKALLKQYGTKPSLIKIPPPPLPCFHFPK